MLPGPAVPGSCWASFHFLWAIHPIRPVKVEWSAFFLLCCVEKYENKLADVMRTETKPTTFMYDRPTSRWGRNCQLCSTAIWGDFLLSQSPDFFSPSSNGGLCLIISESISIHGVVYGFDHRRMFKVAYGQTEDFYFAKVNGLKMVHQDKRRYPLCRVSRLSTGCPICSCTWVGLT